MTNSTVRTRPVARKLASERMARSRSVSLPMPLDKRLADAADTLGVSVSLLLREAVRVGLKSAIDTLRRDQRQTERQIERRTERQTERDRAGNDGPGEAVT